MFYPHPLTFEILLVLLMVESSLSENFMQNSIENNFLPMNSVGMDEVTKLKWQKWFAGNYSFLLNTLWIWMFEFTFKVIQTVFF